MKRPSPTLGFCLTASLLLAAGGCRNGAAPAQTTTANTTGNADTGPIQAVPDQDRYKVIADTTGLFHYSPLQPSGSDLDLKKNTRLTMLSRGRGFSQVKTASGEVGFVGTEDITPLSAAEVAQEDATTMQQAEAAAGGAVLPMAKPTPGASSVNKRTSLSSSGVTIPSDAGRNERLPEPDVRPKPTATPLVNFR